jgi:hypothetical protein
LRRADANGRRASLAMSSAHVRARAHALTPPLP